MRPAALALLLLVPACGERAGSGAPPRLLSQWRLFAGAPRELAPAEGVLPYAVQAELFSDYAIKRRFVRVPPGVAARYREQEAFDLPVGTVLVKAFGYPEDPAAPAGPVRWIETRLLWRRSGGWVALPYLWNEAQTDAELRPGGATVAVAMAEPDGTRHTLQWLVPNQNLCASCHLESGQLGPLGVKARQLNRDYAHAGGPRNQLEHWRARGLLAGGPPAAQAPRFPCPEDPASGTLEARARAWLDANCASCHAPAGRAGSSGMWLGSWVQDPLTLGVGKPPISAAKGTGGRLVGIAPGDPDASILVHRIASTEPGVAMPEIGRTLVPRAGLALVREWIASLR